MTGAALISRSVAALAAAIRLAARGPVSHICCTDDRLVAVIWGRIYWRRVDGQWLADQWVPLALPGEGAAERRSRGGVETAKVKPTRQQRR